MSTHTPGPWVAHFEESYFVTGPDLGRVAMMINLKGSHGFSGRRSGEESAANARLIASVPDLLDALQLLLDVERGGDSGGLFRERLYAAMRKAEKAVAKATGSDK